MEENVLGGESRFVGAWDGRGCLGVHRETETPVCPEQACYQVGMLHAVSPDEVLVASLVSLMLY